VHPFLLHDAVMSVVANIKYPIFFMLYFFVFNTFFAAEKLELKGLFRIIINNF